MLLHPPQMLPVCRGTEEALKEAGLLLKGPEKQSLLIWRTETSLLLRNKTLGEPKRLLPSFLPQISPKCPRSVGCYRSGAGDTAVGHPTPAVRLGSASL